MHKRGYGNQKNVAGHAVCCQEEGGPKAETLDTNWRRAFATPHVEALGGESLLIMPLFYFNLYSVKRHANLQEVFYTVVLYVKLLHVIITWKGRSITMK